MGPPYGENFIILTSTVFYDTPMTNRQTDGLTDGRAIAYRRYSMSRVKTDT